MDTFSKLAFGTFEMDGINDVYLWIRILKSSKIEIERLFVLCREANRLELWEI